MKLGRLGSILLWAVIAAAFIGPGTVTTCSNAGASFGLALLWALVFSTFGCFVLQEAAARVTLASGSSLAQALGGGTRSGWNLASLVLVLGAILLGCAAYQAGNLVGAVAGASLETELPRWSLTVVIAVLAFALLWTGSAPTVARVMGVVVALMGAAFLATAIRLAPAAGELARGSFVPALPDGSGLLVIALVGTTIVPYNLFLGSGLAQDQRLGEVRLGLGVAVGVGGLISMAVVVVGSVLSGAFSFDALAGALETRLGSWARPMFAFGLFCAGFSSAVTAPLAAAMTARGLFGRDSDDWQETGWRYRAVWGGVLATGLVVGVAGFRPVPLIVVAQAFNGLLLPVVASYLVLVVNDRRLMGPQVNGAAGNIALALTFVVAVLLGASNVLRASATALGAEAPSGRALLVASSVIALALGTLLFRAAARRR